MKITINTHRPEQSYQSLLRLAHSVYRKTKPEQLCALLAGLIYAYACTKNTREEAPPLTAERVALLLEHILRCGDLPPAITINKHL